MVNALLYYLLYGLGLWFILVFVCNFGFLISQERSQEDGLFNWNARLRVALGSARGLAYLHHDCVPSIIHRDVKSNNILLDNKLMPKIADFGLAKALIRPGDIESIAPMSRFAGSCGYIAPGKLK